MSDIVERLATARNMIELERAASDAIDEIERLRLMLGSLLDVTAGRMTDAEIKDAYGMLGWDVMRRAREMR
jgi:hypothetical protein